MSAVPALLIAFLIRLSMVALFMPFSALDKLFEFDAAVGQARQAFTSPAWAKAAIVAGFGVEVVMSLGVLTGLCDRLAAFVIAGYCATTAILWKPFWRPGDFRARGPSTARDLFWDFLKNFAVAGGFLLVTFGVDGRGVDTFVHDPLSSTHPYSHP